MGIARSGGIATRCMPWSAAAGPLGLASPARGDADRFLRFAFAQMAPALAGRAITALEIGCGNGFAVRRLVDAGLRGRYLGLDLAQPRRWPPVHAGEHFACELLRADAAALDAATLPDLDLIVSCTALEHIERDARAVESLSTRLGPRGWQAHFVPACAALELYGPHGYRQYAPRDLAGLFPRGVIYRMGGPAGAGLHRVCIGATRIMEPADAPGLYRAMRWMAHGIDRALGHPRPTMLGVIVPPSGG